MTQQTKKAIYFRFKDSYQASPRKEKGRIISLVSETTGEHRKQVIRNFAKLLRPPKPKKPPQKRGRRTLYQSQNIVSFLLDLWKKSQFICSRRLKAAIEIWLPYYTGKITEEEKTLLQKISASSIERILKNYRSRFFKGTRVTTKPGSLLKKHIPIHDNQWNDSRPGFMEADCVSHGGGSASGSYVYSVVLTDIATGWTEVEAVWEKGQQNVHQGIVAIENRLPFRLLGFDSDNGSEFINHHLYSYMNDRKKPVQFTRSRPYKKNDNAHVEQKNWTHVRQYLGYQRIDNKNSVDKINQVYRGDYRILLNYFIPSEKMLRKVKRADRIYKIMKPARTPVDRLIESGVLTQDKVDIHLEIRQSHNPYELIKSITEQIKQIWKDYD